MTTTQPSQPTRRLAAPNDRITRYRMRVAHIVRQVREGTTESASPTGGHETRPYAETRCRIRMWATLADGPTREPFVSWVAPDGMPDCQGCAIGRPASKRTGGGA